jgi:hypothetical protein
MSEAWRDWRKRPKILRGRFGVILLGSLILTSGCVTIGPATNFCSIAEPILISRQDVLTDGTARQILAHNETGRKLCEW